MSPTLHCASGSGLLRHLGRLPCLRRRPDLHIGFDANRHHPGSVVAACCLYARMLAIALFAIAIALWRNDRLGYWLNL